MNLTTLDSITALTNTPLKSYQDLASGKTALLNQLSELDPVHVSLSVPVPRCFAGALAAIDLSKLIWQAALKYGAPMFCLHSNEVFLQHSPGSRTEHKCFYKSDLKDSNVTYYGATPDQVHFSFQSKRPAFANTFTNLSGTYMSMIHITIQGIYDFDYGNFKKTSPFHSVKSHSSGKVGEVHVNSRG